MPVAELRYLVLGENKSRLTYDPSLTSSYERDPVDRTNVKPGGVSDPSPRPRPVINTGHRLYTRVDTGKLSFNDFSVRTPPTAVLLCGREGDILKAVWCHYELSGKAWDKVTMVTRNSALLHQTKCLGWVMVGLYDNKDRSA